MPRRNDNLGRELGPGYVLYDVVLLVVGTLLYGTAAGAAGWVLREGTRWLPWPVMVFPAAIAGLLALVAAASLLCAVCPKLVPGRYPLMRGKVFWGWMARTLVRRCVLVPPVQWLLFSSNLLRWLTLNGLGGKVAFTAGIALDVDLPDPSLLRIGAGAVLGTRAIASGHTVIDGTLVLGEISIGAGAGIAAEVSIAPGVSIAERAKVNARAALGPCVTVGESAVVGAAALIDAYAEIAPGAVVEPASYIAPRQKVAAVLRPVSVTSA